MIGFVKKSLNKALNVFGYEIRKKDMAPLMNERSGLADLNPVDVKIYQIHYGCGPNLLKDWLNVDLHTKQEEGYATLNVNVVGAHPFSDNYFQYGFAEDFIEHLSQADQMIFLSEVYRTFQPGGVLRLSFPGLEGVLKKHYKKSHYEGAAIGKSDAYTLWGHLHFYSREELALVCKHIGFREVNLVEYGRSTFHALNNLDTRKEQIGLNTYVEIIK